MENPIVERSRPGGSVTELFEQVRELRSISDQLHRRGRWVVVLSLVHAAFVVVCLAFLVLMHTRGIETWSQFRLFVLGYESIWMIAVLQILRKYDSALMHGNSIYQDLSERMEGRARRVLFAQGSPPDNSTGVDPLYRATREGLREFALSEGLPLARGPHGGMLYLALNLALSAVHLLLSLGYGRIL